MLFKTTRSYTFSDIWWYLVIDCFDWKTGVFQTNSYKGLIVSLSNICLSKSARETTVFPSKPVRPINVCQSKPTRPSNVYCSKPVCPSNNCQSKPVATRSLIFNSFLVLLFVSRYFKLSTVTLSIFIAIFNITVLNFAKRASFSNSCTNVLILRQSLRILLQHLQWFASCLFFDY